MALADWLRRVTGVGHNGGPPLDEPKPLREAPLREAWGVNVDADEDQWRRLTGNSDRDLSPLTGTRMRRLALYLWETNVLANRLVELPLAYLLAEGVTLTVPNEDAQAWLDAFWRDPINAMDLKLPKKVRELALYGEQCWPAFVNEVSGHVRLGYLDPELIETVVMDPDNAEQPIGIVTRKDQKGNARRYRIIVNGPESVFTARTRGIRETFDSGECFYFRVNDLSNGTRGRSDLLSQIDWLDAYEEFLFGELERGKLLRSFIWDVTLNGATPAEVEERAKKIVAPSPGSVRVHNDSEVWKAESADLGQYESAAGARLFRNHVLAGSTIPEHWFGGGGDVNRATAGEMDEPTFKIFSMRQRIWKHILEAVATFVIWRRLDPTGASYFDPEKPDPELMPEAVFPEMTSADISKYAAALQQVVTATAQAIEAGLMDDELALQIIAAIAGRLGVEFDAEAALEAAQAQKATRREEDVFRELPPDPAEGDEPAGG